MRNGIILICILILGAITDAQVKTGIEVLRENDFSILHGKRVGLITNQTGVDRDFNSTIDILFEADSVNLAALFSPEHGIRGVSSAGENVENHFDIKTGLPVYSLYGPTKKPTKEMLNNIDVLVYDVQDIGLRPYTYISTLGLAMEAASENNIEFIVLDRPNPLGGERIEGNVVENDFLSFVGQYKIPYIYALTCGELAMMINGEGWLANSEKCKLTVIPMEGWKRNMVFRDTGLPWVPPSTHVPYIFSPYYMAATGAIGELGIVSNGVGYTLTFETMTADWMDASRVADKMNELNLPGLKFRPISYKPYYSTGKDTVMSGVQIYITDYNKAELLPVQFYFMQINHELYSPANKDIFELAKESRKKMFDLVMGTSKIRELFTKRYMVDDITSYLNKGINSFRELSKKYYMYN